MIENLTSFEHVQNLQQLECENTCTVLCVSCTTGQAILQAVQKMVGVFSWGIFVFSWGIFVFSWGEGGLVKPYMLRVYNPFQKSNILINILINKEIR